MGRKTRLQSFCPIPSFFICIATPGVNGEVTARSPRFEKDRELEDAIIRKRKSQLVPPQRDTETRARKLCLGWIIWQLKSAAMRGDAYSVRKVASPLPSKGNITQES